MLGGTSRANNVRFQMPETPNPNTRIGIARVRQLCGGVSEMTIWRWLNEPARQFPRPIYIGRRRYWKETEIVAWLDDQSVQT